MHKLSKFLRIYNNVTLPPGDKLTITIVFELISWLKGSNNKAPNNNKVEDTDN